MYIINNFTNHSSILFETKKINYNRINNSNQMESIIIIKTSTRNVSVYPSTSLPPTPNPALQN